MIQDQVRKNITENPETVGIRMRVCAQQRGVYSVLSEDGSITQARVSGRWMYTAKDALDFPVVGDWVWVKRTGESGLIIQLEERKNVLTRIGAAPSGCVRQPIAANLDRLLCCLALGQEPRAACAQRYLASAAAAGIPAMVLLTKADLCVDVEAALRKIRGAFPGVECMAISESDEAGIAALRGRIAGENWTVALAGASGVGKSTLCNALLEQAHLRTGSVREKDGRGRHTTTRRELICLPHAGALIDTPGMRTFALDESDVEEIFAGFEALSARCRFRDCRHTSEPGCALREALVRGEIEETDLRAYLKLLKEQERQSKRRKR